MAEKVTIMVIRVDLGCKKCCKKIKKVLCKIPQIQNQIYEEELNKVIITVVSCCPEKVKDKICRKAGNIILCGVEIVVPPAPGPVGPAPPSAPVLKDNGENGKPKPKPNNRKVTFVEPPKPDPKPPSPKPAPELAPKPPSPSNPKPPEPAPGFPPPAFPQPAPCCWECREGYGWGPCYWDPCMPPPCYGRPVYDRWGGGGCRRIYVSRCSDYVSEENPNAACIIM